MAASPKQHDVLVIGGGPAGAAAAYWLALAGRDVAVVEKKTFPREKTCGDGLTPRAVHQLQEMGLEPKLEAYHRFDGLRAMAHGITLELEWPSHPVFPNYGYVVRRRDLDQLVANHAVEAGATLWEGTEAVAPIIEDGLVTGAVVQHKTDNHSTGIDNTCSKTDSDSSKTDSGGGGTREVRARYVIIADGSNSRFGRALGTARNKTYPQGMGIRAYYESPMHDDPWIESCLDLRDRRGNSLPGYGWVFPVGDGTINVGVGLLSTFRDYKSINTSHLMAEFAATLPDHWGVTDDTEHTRPVGGRLPMAGSVNPKVGPTWVVVGDAAGSINPFNGEGIDYAYETGRQAALLIDQTLTDGNGMALQSYSAWLDDTYGLYFKVARAFSKIIGQPELMRELTRVGMQSRTLMEWVLAIMANLLRDDELGPAEAAYRAVAAIARQVPETRQIA